MAARQAEDTVEALAVEALAVNVEREEKAGFQAALAMQPLL